VYQIFLLGFWFQDQSVAVFILVAVNALCFVFQVSEKTLAKFQGMFCGIQNEKNLEKFQGMFWGIQR